MRNVLTGLSDQTNEHMALYNSKENSYMEKGIKDDLEQIFKKYYSTHREGKLFEAEKGYQEILKKRPDPPAKNDF